MIIVEYDSKVWFFASTQNKIQYIKGMLLFVLEIFYSVPSYLCKWSSNLRKDKSLTTYWY